MCFVNLVFVRERCTRLTFDRAICPLNNTVYRLKLCSLSVFLGLDLTSSASTFSAHHAHDAQVFEAVCRQRRMFSRGWSLEDCGVQSMSAYMKMAECTARHFMLSVAVIVMHDRPFLISRITQWKHQQASKKTHSVAAQTATPRTCHIPCLVRGSISDLPVAPKARQAVLLSRREPNQLKTAALL